MKKALIALSILSTTVAISQVVKTPERKYKVSLTAAEWTSRLQTLSAALQIMRTSTLPANTVSQWSDSIAAFQLEINKQVVAEMNADSTSKNK